MLNREQAVKMVMDNMDKMVAMSSAFRQGKVQVVYAWDHKAEADVLVVSGECDDGMMCPMAIMLIPEPDETIEDLHKRLNPNIPASEGTEIVGAKLMTR